MVQVCQGTKTKNDMLEEILVQYKEMFIITKREFDKVVSVCSLFVVAQAVYNFTCAVCPTIPGRKRG